MLELKSARSLTLGERAELFNAAYEGYVVPFHLDEAMLAFMDDAFDVDLDASRVAFDEAPVGLANLGLRGEDAWIGGVGVVAAARRSGLGETLMRTVHEEAWKRGVRRIWLEVIDTNAGAIALYEKLGYERVRDVEVWSLPAAQDGSAAREVPAEEARRYLDDARQPWQRADGTLAHYDDVRGLVSENGAALFRVGAAVSLLRIAGEAEPLLRALRAVGNVSVLNLPEDDPAADALRALGATVGVRQHEMLLTAGS